MQAPFKVTAARGTITAAMVSALRLAPTPGEDNATLAIHRRGWTDTEGRRTHAGSRYLRGLEKLGRGKISAAGFIREYGPIPTLK
jgi:hypothetical protein